MEKDTICYAAGGFMKNIESENQTQTRCSNWQRQIFKLVGKEAAKLASISVSQGINLLLLLEEVVRLVNVHPVRLKTSCSMRMTCTFKSRLKKMYSFKCILYIYTTYRQGVCSSNDELVL